MIKTKQDLKACLFQDLGIYLAFPHFLIKKIELWLRGSESYPIFNFIYSLRHYEYYLNQENRLSITNKLKKQYWRFIFRHLQLKYNFY